MMSFHGVSETGMHGQYDDHPEPEVKTEQRAEARELTRSEQEQTGARPLAATAKTEDARADVPWWLVRSAPETEAAPREGRGGGAGPMSGMMGVKVSKVEDTDRLNDGVLFRTGTTDHKGRAWGTQRNPGTPPIETFNPRFWDVRAGDVDRLITERVHGPNPEQQESVKQLDERGLFSFNEEDPISARWNGQGLSLTGGHHRTWEISERVREGKIDGETPLRILVHD